METLLPTASVTLNGMKANTAAAIIISKRAEDEALAARLCLFPTSPPPVENEEYYNL